MTTKLCHKIEFLFFRIERPSWKLPQRAAGKSLATGGRKNETPRLAAIFSRGSCKLLPLYNTMKKLFIIFANLAVCATTCFASGDPTSSTTSDARKQITTYERDGTNILQRSIWNADDPSKRIVTQRIVVGDLRVADFVEFMGEHSCIVKPGLPFNLSIGFSPTGGVSSVSLNAETGDGIVETYESNDGFLVPISGRDLDKMREFARDFTSFRDAVIKKEPAKKIEKRMKEMQLNALKSRLQSEFESDADMDADAQELE